MRIETKLNEEIYGQLNDVWGVIMVWRIGILEE